MPSAPNLRLTVLVTREQASAHPSRNSTDGQHQPEAATDKSRSFLLVIKDPENVSLGDLANRIKEQWQELWPTEKPLQIKQLVNGAYPDTAFTVRCSVADIWVDSGRREREGFDQHGIVRVIPVPSSSTSTPTPRHQRAASVFQDVEGAAREAKRKFLDTEISANDSLPRPGATTPSQNKEQTDPQHNQSKRPRLTAQTDPQSPSPPQRFHTTTSSPVYFNGGRPPAFALPKGHRRHLTNTSPGSPELGLGLGITASPARDIINRNKFSADGVQKPSSMPPPPLPRYSLRGSTNSSPPEGSSQDDSPLGARKLAERPYNSVPRETSRNDDRRPRTRAALKASGSSKRSHHARASRDPNATPKPTPTTEKYLEKDRAEIREVEKLLRDPKTNPECLIVLREISDLHNEITTLKAGSGGRERRRLLGMARKRLSRRRKALEKFKSNEQLYDDGDARTITSQEGNAGNGPNEGPDENSDEDLLKKKKNHKRPGIEKRDLSADFVAARRISFLRAYSSSVKTGDSPQSQRNKEPDGHGIQVLIGDNGIEQASLSTRASSTRASQSNDALPEDAAIKENENENENDTTDSEGEDIQSEAEIPTIKHSSPIRKSTASQRTSPRKAPPPGADSGEEENGVNGIYSTAKEVDPSEVAQLAAALEQVPEQQHSPPGKVGLLGQLLQQGSWEALAKYPPFCLKGQTKDESSADDTSEDETSDDDSSDSDGDYKMGGVDM